MSGKMKWKIAVDILMTLALLVLMSYGMAGEAVHEWTGMGKSWKGQIYLFPDSADDSGTADTGLHAGLHGKWHPAFPLRVCVPAYQRLCRSGADRAYAWRLLGICTDVPASGTALEHGGKHGR